MTEQAGSRASNDRGRAARARVRGPLGVLLLLLVLLVAVAGGAVVLGAFRLGPGEVFAVFAARAGAGRFAGVSRLLDTIVWHIRLPRILLSMIVGAALAGAGAVFQGCFRNPLVEPYVLGASSGAALGAAVGMVVPWMPLSAQLSAFLTAIAAVSLVYALARRRGELPVVTLVLAGIIVGSVFSAGVSMLTYLASDVSMRQVVFWLMGGFYFATWRDVAVAGPLVLAGLAAMWAHGWRLNVLTMGDHEARTLGVNPQRVRRILIALATLVTAVSVASVGIIAWVGLMMPHAARLLVGPDHRYAVPAAALLGAIYLVLCDTAARTLMAAEIPVGIVTSLLGAPYLVHLLRSRTDGVLG